MADHLKGVVRTLLQAFATKANAFFFALLALLNFIERIYGIARDTGVTEVWGLPVWVWSVWVAFVWVFCVLVVRLKRLEDKFEPHLEIGPLFKFIHMGESELNYENLFCQIYNPGPGTISGLRVMFRVTDLNGSAVFLGEGVAEPKDRKDDAHTLNAGDRFDYLILTYNNTDKDITFHHSLAQPTKTPLMFQDLLLWIRTSATDTAESGVKYYIDFDREKIEWRVANT